MCVVLVMYAIWDAYAYVDIFGVFNILEYM